MPCPFGFTADDAVDDGDVSGEEEEEEDEAEEQKGKAENVAEAEGKKAKKKATNVDGLKFDFDKDPVSWFYQNQIKSEAEFSKKKEALRAEARKRLDQIMEKKNKKLEWPSDSEFDELSIRSSELSDLDSDVDSLGSLVSCANSWIQDARYGTPAETTLTYAAYVALVAMAYCLWLTIQAVNSTRKVAGVLSNTIWPTAGFACSALLGAALVGVILAVRYRSRRFLLISQTATLIMYSAFLVIMCGSAFQPTAVDPKLHDVACVRYGKSDQGSRLCKMLPGIERELTEVMGTLRWVGGLAATCALGTLSASVWYLHELAYIEKKAIKHKRRHKRRKHSIPWDKLKVVGPVMNCGANKPAGAPAGKCPVMHGGAAAPAVSAAKGSQDKKDD